MKYDYFTEGMSEGQQVERAAQILAEASSWPGEGKAPRRAHPQEGKVEKRTGKYLVYHSLYFVHYQIGRKFKSHIYPCAK